MRRVSRCLPLGTTGGGRRRLSKKFICYAAGFLFIASSCWQRKMCLNRPVLQNHRDFRWRWIPLPASLSLKFLKFRVHLFLSRWKLWSSLLFKPFILFLSSFLTHVDLIVFFSPSFSTHPKPKYNYSFHSVSQGETGFYTIYAPALMRRGFQLV